MTMIDTGYRGQSCDTDECPYCRTKITATTGACTPGCPTGARRARRYPPAPSNNSPMVRRFWDLLIELDYERFGTMPDLTDEQRQTLRLWLREPP